MSKSMMVLIVSVALLTILASFATAQKPQSNCFKDNFGNIKCLDVDSSGHVRGQTDYFGKGHSMYTPGSQGVYHDNANTIYTSPGGRKVNCHTDAWSGITTCR